MSRFVQNISSSLHLACSFYNCRRNFLVRANYRYDTAYLLQATYAIVTLTESLR